MTRTMTQPQGTFRRIVTHRLTRAAACLALLAVVSGGLTACGRYGPPEPYPPGYEPPEDEDEQS